MTYLVSRLQAEITRPLRVLDLCTGSGCIPLLFHHEYTRSHTPAHPPQILGVDIAPQAQALAETNLAHIHSRSTSPPDIHFALADILHPHPAPHGPPSLANLLDQRREGTWDILISNPPYISPASFYRDTARSVRGFEPKIALVPPPTEQAIPASDEAQGDSFYPAILRAAREVDAKVVLVEVADLQQAERVAAMMVGAERWSGVEIWRDEPEWRGFGEVAGCDGASVSVRGSEVVVRGQGHGRSVVCWRTVASGRAAAGWLSA